MNSSYAYRMCLIIINIQCTYIAIALQSTLCYKRGSQTVVGGMHLPEKPQCHAYTP